VLGEKRGDCGLLVIFDGDVRRSKLRPKITAKKHAVIKSSMGRMKEEYGGLLSLSATAAAITKVFLFCH
jgi:hypothetical protein